MVNRVGDTPVGSVDELILALRQNRVGDSVTISYVRDGTTRTAEVVLADKAGRLRPAPPAGQRDPRTLIPKRGAPRVRRSGLRPRCR